MIPERDIVERTGLTPLQVRQFRRVSLKNGAVKMAQHRWYWSPEAAAALLTHFGLAHVVLDEKTAPNVAGGHESAPLAVVEAVLKNPDTRRQAVVFRAGGSSIRNTTVLEAVWPGMDGKNAAARLVVKVRDHNRFKPGQRIWIEPMPGSPWLYRMSHEQGNPTNNA